MLPYKVREQYFEHEVEETHLKERLHRIIGLHHHELRVMLISHGTTGVDYTASIGKPRQASAR